MSGLNDNNHCKSMRDLLTGAKCPTQTASPLWQARIKAACCRASCGLLFRTIVYRKQIIAQVKQSLVLRLSVYFTRTLG